MPYWVVLSASHKGRRLCWDISGTIRGVSPHPVFGGIHHIASHQPTLVVPTVYFFRPVCQSDICIKGGREWENMSWHWRQTTFNHSYTPVCVLWAAPCTRPSLTVNRRSCPVLIHFEPCSAQDQRVGFGPGIKESYRTMMKEMKGVSHVLPTFLLLHKPLCTALGRKMGSSFKHKTGCGVGKTFRSPVPVIPPSVFALLFVCLIRQTDHGSLTWGPEEIFGINTSARQSPLLNFLTGNNSKPNQLWL